MGSRRATSRGQDDRRNPLSSLGGKGAIDEHCARNDGRSEADEGMCRSLGEKRLDRWLCVALGKCGRAARSGRALGIFFVGTSALVRSPGWCNGTLFLAAISRREPRLARCDYEALSRGLAQSAGCAGLCGVVSNNRAAGLLPLVLQSYAPVKRKPVQSMQRNGYGTSKRQKRWLVACSTEDWSLWPKPYSRWAKPKPRRTEKPQGGHARSRLLAD